MKSTRRLRGFFARYRLNVMCTVSTGLVILLTHSSACASFSKAIADFDCGGKVESEVWLLWDTSAKEYLRNHQFSKRLKEQGDTYALYDIQTYTHNLTAMAIRCQRLSRLEELAEVFGTAYSLLEVNPESQSGLVWICKGGAICNSKNRQINREVMLASVQFLALTASVANGLAQLPNMNQDTFIEQTVAVSIQHLLRWGGGDEMRKLDEKIIARSQDVMDGSSELFFTDKHLWMIAIYANLAGILRKEPSLRDKAELSHDQVLAMSGHFSRLLELFAARTSVETTAGRSGQSVKVADLDRGFWRLHYGNKYAGYTGREKPIACIRYPDGRFEKKVLVDGAIFKPVNDLGWDISHARRLVHTFEAIERNRQEMTEIFGIQEMLLPSAETIRAFAQQLVVRVWNGNSDFPLFSNYLSGANGWYRVSYNNGTNRCMEGYPPFGITDSFATGGYSSWARYEPETRNLGRRLYRLSMSSDESHRLFIDKYYPKLGPKGSDHKRMLTQLMFWPSLVDNPEKVAVVPSSTYRVFE